MNHQLKTQLKDPETIKNVIKEHNIEIYLEDGRLLNSTLVYIDIKDGKSSFDALFSLIEDTILHNFAFSSSEVKEKLQDDSMANKQLLFRKAVRKLSRHTAKGELGELLLFTLLDVYHQAPKILSKISLKTNRKMPVFGADAVHGQFSDGHFFVFLGESKLHKKFGLASTKATESIIKGLHDYQTEFDLLDSYIDFPDLGEDLKTMILDLLDPFKNSDTVSNLQSPCFIGFTDKKMISRADTIDDFLANYETKAKKNVPKFFKKLEALGGEINHTQLFILPFSCVTELTEGFIKHMGIEV